MGLHDLKFLGSEFSGFVKYAVGNIDLAHIMKRGTSDNIRHKLRGYLFRVITFFLQTFNYYLYISGSFLNVCAGVGVTIFHHVCHGHDEALLHLCRRLVKTSQISHLLRLI